MAFDPDQYLARKESEPTGFDPDAYLQKRSQAAPEFTGAPAQPPANEDLPQIEEFGDPAPIGVAEGETTFRGAAEQLQQTGPGRFATELASAINRGAINLGDFLTAGQLTNLAEAVGAGGFIERATAGGQMEPGLAREVVQTGGEMTGPGAAIGAGMRTAARMIPESTKVLPNVLRQMGGGTAAGDVALSGVSGAGQEIGREIGGETGAAIGGLAAPVVASIPVSAAKITSNKLLKEAAPSVDKLKETARGIYKSIDEAGVKLPSSQVDDLLDDVMITLRKEGVDQDVTPKAFGLFKRLGSEKGQDKLISEIDTLRKVARGAAQSADPAEQRLGSIAIDKIDDFLDQIPTAIKDNKEIGQAYRSARDLWQRAKKSEVLDQAVELARGQASGFENGLRVQFRSLSNKITKGQLKGFTPDEIAAIKQVNEGTTAGYVARFLGKFGVLDGITSRSLTTAAGAGFGGVVGGAPGAAAVPLIGQVSGALAQRLTANNARMATQIVRAGKNHKKILSAYLRNTPKDQRSAEELAELFIRNEAPIESINLKNVNRLAADAAIIAAIAKMNEDREESQ